MLDLKKIEKKIDELLASETEESLRTWIDSQNRIDVDSYLGEGEYIETLLSDVTCVVDTNTHNGGQISPDRNNDYIDSSKTQYAMAA